MLFLYLLHPSLLWSFPLFAFNISPCTLCGMNKEGCLFYDWELWGGKKQAPEKCLVLSRVLLLLPCSPQFPRLRFVNLSLCR